MERTKINFLPFPILTTKRLLLRNLKDSDAREIFFLRSDDCVNKYLDRQKMKNKDEAKEFIIRITDGIKLNKWIYWAVCLKDNSELIGTICLWNFSDDKTTAEIGYELIPSFQAKGLMNEALRCIINYGFQTVKLQKIEAYTHRENVGSLKLLEKNNFKLEAGRTDESNANNIIYSISK